MNAPSPSAPSRPPRLGSLLLRIARLGERRREVEADLLELFALRLAHHGRRVASYRYIADVFSLGWWRPRRQRPTPRPSRGGLHAMTQDVIFAARLFRRRPGLFGLTVAGLAVAIGISTAIFSIVHATAFADYGLANPDGVIRVALASGPLSRVTGNSPYRGNWAFAEYQRLTEGVSALDVVASVQNRVELRADPWQRDPLPVGLMAVSGNYFTVLGLQVVSGRPLGLADDVPGTAAVVVSEAFWKNRLHADPAIVGQTVWLSDRPFVVVGVAHRAHSAPSSVGAPPSFWTTLAADRDSWAGGLATGEAETRARLDALKRRAQNDPVERDRLAALDEDLSAPAPRWNPAVDVFGRIKPGGARVQAETEVNAVAVTLAGSRTVPRPLVALENLREHAPGSLPMTLTLAATVGVVVLLGCANVTNLLLASAAMRRREIGTRLAIGASHGRIVQQLLTESMLLGLIGGAGGWLLALAVLPTFAALVNVPPAFDVSPDWTVTMFVGVLTITVGIIAGLAPARYGRRGDLISTLTGDQQAAPRPLPKGRVRSLLIGGQAMASIVLLIVAALLTRAMVRSTQVDLGFDATHLMSVSIGNRTSGARWTAPRREAYWNAALERLREVPGVTSAALADVPPFSGITAASGPNGRRVNRTETSADYFALLGVRVLRGRTYTQDEIRHGAPVAVISARLAREYWGEADAIGDSLERVWGPENPAGSALTGTMRKPHGTRVIGIVSDVVTDLRSFGAPTIYLPLARNGAPRLVLRTRDDPHAMARGIQTALETVDPGIRASFSYATEGLQRDQLVPRMLAALSATVGTTALGLAVIGLFGVTALVVEQRRHEVSVRKALGATTSQLVSLLWRDSLRPVAAGLALGVLAALLAGHVIQGVLYGVSSRDPLAIVAAVAILLAAASTAVLLPARRAARVSPAELLKQS